MNAKSSQRRLVQMLPNLRAWLLPYAGFSGKVWKYSESMWRVRLDPVKQAAGVTSWPENGLRHSFGSYHLVQFGDAARLALEMGHTTTKEIFAHYREVVQKEEGQSYWAITPSDENDSILQMEAVS